MDLQHSVHNNKERAFQHSKREKLSEINRENMKILNKLVEISKGKQVSTLQLTKSAVHLPEGQEGKGLSQCHNLLQQPAQRGPISYGQIHSEPTLYLYRPLLQ